MAQSLGVAGKKFAFTGTLSMFRAEAVQKLEAAGGIFKKSVTKDTDFLVAGTPKPNDHIKRNKAVKYGIKFLSEQEFVAMLVATEN